jgi:glyoxylase-like metal-dependent hydrolase (beta-lactamase superfamily II)
MNRPENPFAPRTYGQWEQLTPRVGLWRNIVNSTVFVGERGVAVIDTQVNQALAARLLAAIQAIYGKPVLYAVNTHYHWDHTSGNAVFKAAGATLVASRRTAAAMVERAPRQKGFLSSRGFDLGADPLPPDVFSDDRPVLDLGGLSVELRPGHDAETADPTLAWCAQEGVLAAGDTVMTGSFPIFGQPSQREGLEDAEWLKALDEVRAFGAGVVAPGHGPAARAADLAQLERIMRWFLEHVPPHHAAGRSLAETIAILEDEMPAWLTRIQVVWGTPRYAILRVWAGLADLGQPGWQHVKPSAIPAPRAAVAGEPAADLARWRERVAQAVEGGDAGQAVAVAEAMTAAHPGQAVAWTALAHALVAASRGIASVLEKGDCFGRARAALDRALEIDPACGEAWLQAGQFHVMMAYRNGDDPARGLACLERAAGDARLEPRARAEIAFYRAIAARARGDEAAARAGFADSLCQDPGFRPAMLAQMG